MGEEYLSVGFRDVDGAEDTGIYSRCLALLDSLPYYREYKHTTYSLLKLREGLSVLEAGCGLGDDAFRMAEKVMPGGRVTAVDSSEAMLRKAREDERAVRLPVEFLRGDIKALPFCHNSFSRCRIDRVLQHVPDPRRAVAELVRVLEPGGLLLAYDNDWGTFSLSSHDVRTTRTMENLWCDTFANPWVGRYLHEFFRKAGLHTVARYPGVSVIDDFETADRVYNLKETARRAVEAGAVSKADAARWLDDLVQRSHAGYFAAALTAYTVVGVKNG